MKNEIEALVMTLHRSIGNKGYMREIAAILRRLDLTPQERQALLYLARDIEDLEAKTRRSRQDPIGMFLHR